MKILFATEYYPPFAPGGSPWSIRLLAEALAGVGHEVTIVTPNWGAPEREQTGPVTVVRFPLRRRLGRGAVLAPTRALVSPFFHLRFFRAIVGEARRCGADVIHAQDKHALVASYLAARRLGRAVFLTLRDVGLVCPIATCLLSHEFVPADCSSLKLQRECAGFYLDRYVPGGPARRARVRLALALLYLDARLKNHALRRLDGLIGVSAGLLEIYLRAGRGRRERAHVVYPPSPPPVDADVGAVDALRGRLGLGGKRTVLYVGKLSLGKGGPVFLEAVKRVARVRADVAFVVAGPDDPGPAPPSADVRWLGRLDHGEMPALYALADLVVVPSVGPEALSRVPLEAAAAARPTIGARAGGIPEEIVDGETGLLVPRGSADDLAVAILRLLDDDQLRVQLGRNARATVADRFGTAAVARALLDVYAGALRR
ncbi:MAG: glycosyltransferase family 4 protein [Candidatus Rokuibacteriota bacterium]